MDRVRDSATAQLSTQKTRATESLGTVAQAVRQSAKPFRDHRQDTIAEYVERAADQLDQFSRRLRERDLNELVEEAQRFARRQPAFFIGAAFTAGLLGARFLKSSSDRRSAALQRDEPGWAPGYRGAPGAYGVARGLDTAHRPDPGTAGGL